MQHLIKHAYSDWHIVKEIVCVWGGRGHVIELIPP